MGHSSKQILVVDDDRETCELLAELLGSKGYHVKGCATAAGALDELSTSEVDAVLTDVAMKDMDGLELCERIVACRPDVPVLVMTGNGRLESAVAALRVGAYDFIVKPPEPEVLGIALDRAVQHHALRSEATRLRNAIAGVAPFGDLEGKSAPMLRLHELLQRAAETDASVLLSGESGTGKEVAARALHHHSRRHAQPFVAVNCAAMPAALLESELFGHVRGAFTGAATDRPGLLVGASGGTVFLDEIGEMPLSLQPKLLRAIEGRVVRPLGSSKEVPFDARLVAATNRDLEQEVEQGRFRADLFFRLNVIAIDLPPLRMRGNDILLLAGRFRAHFAKRNERPIAGLTPAAAHRLLDYSWPGNVRELKNCIERAVALSPSTELSIEDLPPTIQAAHPSFAGPAFGGGVDALLPLEMVEREHVERVLGAVKGNKREAARLLGLDRRTLYRKLERWARHRPN